MGQWSQSQFLQALGWATLNSFWQMAVLWCAFLAVNQLFKFDAAKRYRAAVSALFVGMAWFVVSAIAYYQNQSSAYAFFQNSIPHSNSLLNTALLAASVTYLLLLIFPVVKLFKNWRFVQRIKTEGQSKAALNYRLFVQNVSGYLGIKKKVKLVVSSLVASPVTVGYLKPIILLPVAALNNLTTAQVEAILLHELSHIRRYDYLVNFVVSVIHTLLYFNPFVRLFMNTLEAERETCCDEMVLQFGYDKVGYASALLHLEKTSAQIKSLALAAAGRQTLVTRIEKIVGMEKKRRFRLAQVIPLMAALFCVLLFNSVLIIRDAKIATAMTYSNDTVFMPWSLEGGSGSKKLAPAVQKPVVPQANNWTASSDQIKIDIINEPSNPAAVPEPSPLTPAPETVMPVNFDDVTGHLSSDAKEDIKTTVEASKKAVSQLHWREIDAAMADVLNEKEKARMKQELAKEVNDLNWENVARNLAANYDNLNWKVIRENTANLKLQVQADSLQSVFNQALAQLEKAEKEIKAKAKVQCSPIPDGSLEQLEISKQTLRKNIEQLGKLLKPKKVIDL